MKALLTSDQSKTLDAATINTLALDPLQLMEKASLRIWDALRLYIAGLPGQSEKGEKLRITALCGKGDNGGDALAIIRHAFSSGIRNLDAVISGRELSPSAQKQTESLISAGIIPVTWDGHDEIAMMGILAGADIVLDGVLGTGLAGSAVGEAKAMIDCLNKIRLSDKAPLIVSIDIPSGASECWMASFPCVEADLTFCLEPVKASCYLPGLRSLCGILVPVADVFPQRLVSENKGIRLLETDDLKSLLTPVEETGYKMSRGRLAIFAGSMGAIGAAQLCARAALASGAGYVTLYVDEEIYPLIAPTLESVIVKVLTEKPVLSVCDTILVGPGWGQGPGRLQLLTYLLESPLPVILDADAIRLLAGLLADHPELVRGRKAPCAATPHPGEFAALAGAFGDIPLVCSWEAMGKVSETYSLVAVIKSHTTWIVSPEGSRFVWDGMTPELGTAGSGDVLAGLFAGLMAGKWARADATQKAFEESACLAVIAHGLAGRTLAQSRGWFESSDLVAECSSLLHPRKETP